jgi:mannosyltransferase
MPRKTGGKRLHQGIGSNSLRMEFGNELSQLQRRSERITPGNPIMQQELAVAPRSLAENRTEITSEDQYIPSWKWMSCLASIMFLALFLRIVALDYHSFWYDEAVTAKLTESPTVDLIRGRAKDNGNPPLYWMVSRGWSSLFGRSEIGFRTLSLLFGLLTILVLALLGRQLLGPTTGLLAAGLLAISPFHIELSNEARPYALLGFFIVINTYFFIRWIDQNRLFDLAIYSFTTFLACYSHYYALILPVGQFICLLTIPQRWRLILPWFGAMGVAGLLWIPWLPAFFDQLRTPGNLSRYGDGWKYQFLSTPVVFSLGRTFAWRDSSRGMLGLAAFGTLVGFGIPALLALFRLRRQTFSATVLGAWLLFPILCPLIVAFLFSPIYHVRAGSVGFFAFILLVAFGLTQFPPILRSATICLILVLTGISLYRYSTEPLKDDWKSATPAILQTAGNGEPIIFDTSIEVTSFMYYVPRFGAVPEEMIGIVTAERESILGVRYQNGIRIDRTRREYLDQIVSMPAFCLVLCVPDQSASYYEEFLVNRGYSISRKSHFHRIDVIYFVRNSNEAGTARTSSYKN